MASHPLPSLSAFASIVADLEPAQPLAGARIACTLPRTAATDILIAALERLGGEVHRAGTGAANGLLGWPNQAGPTLLLEHGAALSRLIHAGTRAEGRNGVPAHRAQPYSAIATAILGSTEVTAAGARWMAQRAASNELLYPAMDCTACGPFAALSPDDRGMRTSAALSLLLLSQVHLFRSANATGWHPPPSVIARAISAAHDELLLSQIEKIRPADPVSVAAP